MLETKSSRGIAATGLGLVVAAAATWSLLISPKMAEASELSANAESMESQASSLEAQIAQLRDQMGSLPERRAELIKLQESIPSTAAVPELSRNLRALATASNVKITSFSPGEGTSYDLSGGDFGGDFGAAPGGTTDIPAEDSAIADGTAADTGEEPTSPSDMGYSEADAMAAASPVAGANGLYRLAMGLEFEGDYFQMIDFIRKLQTELPRTMLITQIDMAGGDAEFTEMSSLVNGTLTVTLAAEVYFLPMEDTSALLNPAGADGGEAGEMGTDMDAGLVEEDPMMAPTEG